MARNTTLTTSRIYPRASCACAFARASGNGIAFA
jgi:hypothetical protein